MAHIELRGTRPSVLAGTWYPGSSGALKTTVERYLQNVPTQKMEGEVIGLIAPHAGYVYSGPVAAYAYRLIEDTQFDTVLVVSPTHRGYVPESGAAINAASAYSTPLGEVSVDQELVDRLGQRVNLSLLHQDQEHSLEIQLPFLQVALKAFRLVPIMMVDQSYQFAQELGDAIGALLQDSGRRALLVASTDLSHFHNDRVARGLDQITLDLIESYDIEGLAKALHKGTTEACGGGPVMAVLTAGKALGANRARILHYATSADVTGDRSRVVGYAAGALLRE